MSSAAYAVQAIQAAGDVQREYAALMRRHHAPSLRRVQQISRVLRHPWLAQLASGPALIPTPLLARLIAWVHLKVPT